MRMTVYEWVAIGVGLAFVVLLIFTTKMIFQLEKTLKSVEDINKEVKDKTLKNVEDLTNDIKEKSKKLDPAFDTIEKVGNVSAMIKTGYDLFKSKKK